MEGWLNTDYSRNENRTHLDVTQPFPLPDASFDYVFSEHMIERIDYAGARVMILECYRLLKPGGVVRLVTPDFAFLYRLYQRADPPRHQSYVARNAKTFIGDKAPHDILTVINNDLRYLGHKYVYDVAGLTNLLTNAGFQHARPCELLKSNHTALAGLEKTARMPSGMLALVSLVIEATKP